MNCTFHDLHWEKEISLKGYFLPESLTEALQILSQSQGKARVVAGGTDVVPQLRRKEFEVDFLVDISRIRGLDSIKFEDGIFAVGSMLTHSGVCGSEPLREKARLFVEGAEALGSPQVRNLSTVGGNLVSGQAAADTSLPLLALNASVKILSPRGSEVTDYTAAYDIGKAINPKWVEGQIEGGIGMGVGFALMEEIVVKDGYIQNLGLDDFLIPTVLDMPPITPIIIEQENKLGPYGAKGIGEMANIPSAPAIVNAITHACGGRVRSLPADPEKVFMAIREKGGRVAD
jgi:hypothetical protein